MRNLKTNFKKIVITLSVIVFSAIILFSIPIVNNIHAENVKKDLLKIPLPEKTELIDSISIAEKLVGNGNGMQYFGAILIKSELSLDDLDRYYSQHRNNDWSYQVEVQTDKNINIIYGKASFNVTNESALINHFIVLEMSKTNLENRIQDKRV